MPLSDQQIDALIAHGATDDEIVEISTGRPDIHGSSQLPTSFDANSMLADQDPAEAITRGTGSKLAGAMVKPLNYLTGLPSLMKTIPELAGITEKPERIEAMTPKQKASLGARTLMGGAGAVGVAGAGPMGMIRAAAKAAPGLALYNETGLADKVNEGIDTAFPNSPYFAEAAKILPQLAVGSASTSLVNAGGKAMGVGAEMKPVPKGKEASELVNVAKKEFGAGDISEEGINEKGNLRAAFKGERKALGEDVGSARDKVAEVVDANPEFDPSSLTTKIKHALNRSLSPKDLKANPAAAKALTDLANESDVTSFAEAQGVAERVSNILKSTLKPNGPANSLASPVWKRANDALASVLDKHAKEFGGESLEALEGAKKPFGQWATLQDLINKAFIGGEFSPEKFLDNWKSLSYVDKVAKLKPEQIRAVEAMVKQPGPSMLEGLGKIVSAVPKAIAYKTGMGGLGALLEPKPPQVRFNAPTGNTPATLGKDLVPSGLASARQAFKKKFPNIKLGVE